MSAALPPGRGTPGLRTTSCSGGSTAIPYAVASRSFRRTPPAVVNSARFVLVAPTSPASSRAGPGALIVPPAARRRRRARRTPWGPVSLSCFLRPLRGRMPAADLGREPRGLGRPPTAGLVGEDRGRAAEDRLHDGPRRLDAVLAREERRVTLHRFAE